MAQLFVKYVVAAVQGTRVAAVQGQVSAAHAPPLRAAVSARAVDSCVHALCCARAQDNVTPDLDVLMIGSD